MDHPATGVFLVLVLILSISSGECETLNESLTRLPSEDASAIGGSDKDSVRTRWAVLIAGSSGYGNYRHQADVCHAYQIMKRGGLKDENIVIFMYDDIAYSVENPRPGVIIHHPQGSDVYAGVPKDYVGDDVTVDNFFAVILGNKTALTGGSGKVVDSGPNDRIFIYYAGHGGPGVLELPTHPDLYANDLVEVLKKKHASGSYKSLVFYLEACEAGSIFDGLLPEGLNIYATTASNASESSYGTYCPGEHPSPPPEYYTCLGDLYSVAWMEDSGMHNLRAETLRQQYKLVKNRTSNQDTYYFGSHVMQYGDVGLNKEHVFLYIGTNPTNENFSIPDDNALPSFSKAVNQRDAGLVYFWNKFRKAPEGSSRKLDAQRELLDVMTHRMHVDKSMELICNLLFGSVKGSEVLKAVRPTGLPLVDDWSCLKTVVRTFEMHCGSLSQYGMKHMRSMANICNAGIKKEMIAEASKQACYRIPSGPYSSLERGFSA